LRMGRPLWYAMMPAPVPSLVFEPSVGTVWSFMCVFTSMECFFGGFFFFVFCAS
jgi:hypothetical protein